MEAAKCWQRLATDSEWRDSIREDRLHTQFVQRSEIARYSLSAKNWFAALFHLRWLCQQEPANAVWWAELGRASAEQGQWDESRRAHETAIKLSPDDTTLRYGCALAALATDDSKAFLRGLGDLMTTAEKSKRSDVWDTAAWLATLSGAEEIPRPKLRTLAQKAVASNENEWSCHETLGASLYRSGDFEAAIKELHKAIELCPSEKGESKKQICYFSHAFLALAHYQLKQKPESDKHRRVLEKFHSEAPEAPWQDRELCRLLDAEIVEVCGQLSKESGK